MREAFVATSYDTENTPVILGVFGTAVQAIDAARTDGSKDAAVTAWRGRDRRLVWLANAKLRRLVRASRG